MDSDRDIYFKNLREIVNGSSQYSWIMALLEGIPNISDGDKSARDLISKLKGGLSDPDDGDTLWCLGNAYVSYTLSIPDPELAARPFSNACKYFQLAYEKDTTNMIYWKSILMNKEVPELHRLIHAYSPDRKLTSKGPKCVMLCKLTRNLSIFDHPEKWLLAITEDTKHLPGPERPMEEIISDLEELFSVDRNDHDILWCLGNVCAIDAFLIEEPVLAAKRYRQACMYFQQAVEKDPTNEMYNKSLQMTNEVPSLRKIIYPSDSAITKEVPELHRNMHEDEPDQQLAGGGPSGSSNTTDWDRGSDQLDSSVELAKISFLIDRNEILVAQQSLKALLGKYPKCFAAMALEARVSGVLKENAVEVCQRLVEFVDSFDEKELTDDALRSMEAACLSINRLELASNCYKGCYSNAEKDMSLRNRFLMGRIRCCYFMEQFEELRKLAHLLAENLVSSQRDPEEVEIANIWLCCAYQLEAYAPYTTNRNDLLHLAAVSVKIFSAQGFITKGGLIMAISLLANCSMHADVLAVIEKSPNNQLAFDGDVLLIKGRSLHETCQYNAACDTFKQVLQTCSADWTCFLCYLDSLLEGNKSSLSRVEVNSRLTMALGLVSQITKESRLDPIFIYRAALEIERRKYLYGEKAHLVDTLLKYFSRAGQLGSFIFDATTTFEALSSVGKGEHGRFDMNQILELMYKDLRPYRTDSPFNKTGFFKMITMHKIQFAIMDDTFEDNNPGPSNDEERKVDEKFTRLVQGPDFDKEEPEVVMVRRMIKDYYTHLHLSKNIGVEEPMYGEELLSMAFDLLLQIYWRTKESSCIMEAIGFLEFGLTLQKYSHEYTTLLIQIYSFVGAFELAYNHYKKLQITNSLLLGECLHNFLALMLKSPSNAPLKKIIDDYIMQMEVSVKESLSRTYIGFACTTEVQPVVETYVFINRMKNSCQFVSAKIEHFILELSPNSVWFKEQKDFGEDFLLDEEKLKSLTFSEDLSSRPWWTSSLAINHLLGKRTGSKVFKPLKGDESLRKNLQRRSLIPRLISLSLQAAHERLVDKSEFKKYIQIYARSFDKSLDEAYVFIDAAVKGGQIRKDLLSVSDTLDWMNFAVFHFGWSLCDESGSGPPHRTGGCDLWYIVVQLVERLISHSLELKEPALGIINGIIPLVREPMSWYIMIVKARLGWLRSISSEASLSKNQKKKLKRQTSKRRNSLEESIGSLQKTLNNITKWLDKQYESLSSDDLLAAYQKQYCDRIDLKSIVEPGDRIETAVNSWDQLNVPKNVLSAQCATLAEFSEMCMKLLKETNELLKKAGKNEDNG